MITPVRINELFSNFTLSSPVSVTQENPLLILDSKIQRSRSEVEFKRKGQGHRSGLLANLLLYKKFLYSFCTEPGFKKL